MADDSDEETVPEMVDGETEPEMAVDQLAPVFPFRTQTQSPRDRPKERCTFCTLEKGSAKAKQSREVCSKCQKPICNVHSEKVCTICIQDLPSQFIVQRIVSENY